jgi:organic hydroperoxide reductase OsmC/OhrA
MSTHTAEIHWTCQGEFATKQYSRRHEWRFDGGVVVPASSSPHVVPLPYSDATAVDPEEAFVASLSSCHMLWFLDLACRAGLEVASYSDVAVGEMGLDAHGRVVIKTVCLRPATRFVGSKQPDIVTLQQLHHRAHEECFLANSVKTDIRCEPSIVHL